MNLEQVRAIANRYATLLRICCPPTPVSIPLARTVHANMIASGFKPRAHIVNRLIDIYCKSSNLVCARNVFDEIPLPDGVARTTMIAGYSTAGEINLACRVFEESPLDIRDTVMYNAMITGFSHNNYGHSAVNLFCKMKHQGFNPDNYTFTSVLGALALIVEEEKHCQQMHGAVLKSGTGFVTSVLNALISVYVKCASSPFVCAASLLDSARKVFDGMPVRDELSWTTMITGYVRNDDLNTAREILEGMDEKLGVAWNAMISGYVHQGLYQEALDLFRRMQLSGTELDEFTYTSVISACANSGLLHLGKQMHAYIIRKAGTLSQCSSLPVNNALASLYWRSGKVDEARIVFDHMPIRDLVSWNAVLSGYVSSGRIDEAKTFFKKMTKRDPLSWTIMISALAQNGYGEDGLKLFTQMKRDGFEPCDYAFAGAITSCSVLGALENGRQLHSQLLKSGYDSSLSAGNAIITMYARCGTVDAARSAFLALPCVDSVSWNALIAALGQHGHGAEAVQVYEEMLKEGIQPDRITFLTVLTACSHAGLVEEGRKYFDSMPNHYNITPGEDHYARVIDMLCRSGKFSDAKQIMDSLPFEPGAQIWEALLAGCRIHGNMELGVVAAEKLFKLTPKHDGSYVLLSNIYAAVGRWEEVARVRLLMRDRGVKKEPGCSWVEVEKKVHVFLVDDTAHPEVQSVYNYLEEMVVEMKKLGYVPDVKLVLHEMESDEQKADALSTHSEKIAVAYGLMKLSEKVTIRVFKNLRTCRDCHNFLKFASSLAGREIVVRDAKRFHHFSDGVCSCGDFW